MGKKIKILLAHRDMTQADLARALHISRSAMSERFKRNHWTVEDLEEIAGKLDSDFRCCFILKDSGQEI